MVEVIVALPSEPHDAAGVAIQADDDAGLTTHVRNILDTPTLLRDRKRTVDPDTELAENCP
jgi:hypothetical protein